MTDTCKNISFPKLRLREANIQTMLLTGETALTRTPDAAHSKANVLVRLSTPARAAPE